MAAVRNDFESPWQRYLVGPLPEDILRHSIEIFALVHGKVGSGTCVGAYLLPTPRS